MAEKLYLLTGKITIDIEEEVYAQNPEEVIDGFWSIMEDSNSTPTEILGDGTWSKVKIKQIKDYPSSGY
jgi:hypothetical protein